MKALSKVTAFVVGLGAAIAVASCGPASTHSADGPEASVDASPAGDAMTPPPDATSLDGSASSPPPAALSYPPQSPFLVRQKISPVSPAITGVASSYAVVPALPPGLALDPASGVLSGTPTVVTPQTTYTITATSSTGSTEAKLALTVDPGPTVTVTVAASDPGGHPLHYRWRSTDGDLHDADAPSVVWVLPPGPGLHFAYVLVSNGFGGYTERRLAVNTDAIGNPAGVAPQRPYSAPAAALPTGDQIRGMAAVATTNTRNVYSPDLSVIAYDEAQLVRFPLVGFAEVNLRGEYVIPSVPYGTTLGSGGQCSFDHGVTSYGCTTPLFANASPVVATALTAYFGVHPLGSMPLVVGTAALTDGAPCGTSNEFFGARVAATATLLDAASLPVGPTLRLDAYGGYALPVDASALSVRLQCEASPAVKLALASGVDSGDGPVMDPAVLGSSASPAVTNMSATFNGTPIGAFLPPPSGQPSDAVAPSDRFLGAKGLDTRVSACQYYRAIGAVQACGPLGQPTGAITFEDWKRAVGIDAHAPAGAPPTYTATYINKVDLNLAREHHSISYGSNTTAAYVCNHLGPKVAEPLQAEIDSVIDATVNGRDLVACVAMDHQVNPGVNGGQALTRFLTFGPSGELLPSVNLDGRREKFVPGTCVVCHGGEHYAGRYPEDGTGRADIGGHFLPYDAGNFEFSSKPGLTAAGQELAIYNLNQNVLNAGPTAATSELIAGWYANGSKTLDRAYVPPSWAGQSPAAVSFYKNVVARACRTCHVAMAEDYNFEHYPMGGTVVSPIAMAFPDMAETMCNRSSYNMLRSFSMPNSLVTFNEFWNSRGAAVDLPSVTLQFLTELAAAGNYPMDTGCTLVPAPP
jgi:hypothetical protein